MAATLRARWQIFSFCSKNRFAHSLEWKSVDFLDSLHSSFTDYIFLCAQRNVARKKVEVTFLPSLFSLSPFVCIWKHFHSLPESSQVDTQHDDDVNNNGETGEITLIDFNQYPKINHRSQQREGWRRAHSDESSEKYAKLSTPARMRNLRERKLIKS